MLALGSLAFVSPWLLLGLGGLPIIWWLLRVTPPAPRRIAFPAIRLLLGLVPREETPARTPMWLILLRMTLATLVILAVAHLLLNPQAKLASSGPIIFVVDDGWAAARDWPARQAALNDLLARADREGRQVVLVTTAPQAADEPPAPLAPQRAADARAAVEALLPKPWPVDRRAALARLEALSLPTASSAIWLSDGLADGGADDELAAYLSKRGGLRYGYQRNCPQQALHFSPGTTWLCFSDQVMHAAVSGQHMLEQTIHVPTSALYLPESSPLAVLERLCGRRLLPTH